LAVRGLGVSYGRVQVCSDVDLVVQEGSVCALVGTNGAGKSTLLRAIAGVIPARRGTVELFGQDMTGLRPEQRACRGLVLAAGGRGTFASLSVEEAIGAGTWCYRHDRARVTAAFDAAVSVFPPLRTRRRQRAGTLSGGEQQMLTLARAMIARPRVLLIDELTLGLAPAAADQVLAAVAELPAQGTTVLLVEQSISRALAITQFAWFLERGQVRFAGPSAELAGRSDLLRPVLLSGTNPGGPTTRPDVHGPRSTPPGEPGGPR
jgi:ABC-type branched-subunit amino acid transport system ATPase component